MSAAQAIASDPIPVWGHKFKDHVPRGIKIADTDKTPSNREKVIDPSDPRWYVRALAIPTSDHVGLKINARHLVRDNAHYNPSEPQRDSVRDDNYKRRLVQYTCQGFHSAPHKPYQGVGDPFYLEQKNLLLHALGQWDEGALTNATGSENAEGENGSSTSPDLAKNAVKIAPVKFVLQRARKDLNNISNEEKGGRRLSAFNRRPSVTPNEQDNDTNEKILRIRNVKLGHALKQELKQETDEKQGAKLKQENKKREILQNAWRGPHFDSDDETSEAETDIETDLSNYMIPYNPPSGNHDGRNSDLLTPKDALLPNRVNFFSMASKDKSVLSIEGLKSIWSKRSKTGTSSSTWRQKVAAARPFTPLHTSITAENFTHWPDKESLFRQLCALYWILEAMNLEPHLVMSPITTSWYLDEIGGCKIPASKQADAKKIDSDWSSWKRWKIGEQGHFSSRSNKKMGMYSLQRRATTVIPQPDAESRSTMSSSQSLNTSSNQHSNSQGGATHTNPAIEEDAINEEKEPTKQNGSSRTPTRLSFASDIQQIGGKQQFLEEKETSENEDESGNHGSRARINSAGRASAKKAREKRTLQESQAFARQLDSINREEMDSKLQALANPKDKRNSRELRAETNIRPKSAPWVVEYENVRAPSNKWRTMPTRLRQKFEEITEEKALMLHDAVEAKDRERSRIMQSKLLYLSTGVSKDQLEQVEKKVSALYKTGNKALAKAIEGKLKNLSQESGSFHRAVDWMRTLTKLDQKILEKSNSSTDQPWYMDLKANIPDEMQNEWHIKKVLNLLGKYGQINSAKQSAYKFLDVLCKLREWELCSPDITSAVEFCRDRIVDMSVDDYEAWFKNQFPMIIRPQTAPPTGKTEPTKVKADQDNVKVKSTSRSLKSAPPIRTS